VLPIRPVRSVTYPPGSYSEGESVEWKEKWWFATADEIKASDYNLSGGRYRPLSQAQVEHRDPIELLDELAAIEAEIMEEI
jgi:type I restriction enzyme M protein